MPAWSQKGSVTCICTNGIKRHLAVDTLGLPFFTHCTKANVTDDQGLIEMFSQNLDYFRAKPVNIPKITILLDHGYHPETGKIPDYDELRKIIFRTESILSCPEFKLNSLSFKKTVNVFCKEQNQQQKTIQGQVTEYTVSTSESIELKVITPAKEVYIVMVSRQTLNQIPINPIDAVDQSVQLKNVIPKKTR